MIEVKYTPSAKHDFSEIKRFYSEISSTTFENILDDISSSIEIIKSNPEAGMSFRGTQRRIITPKYRFVIVYLLEENNQSARLIGIYRYQNR